MKTATRPLRLGSLELLSDRLVQTKYSGDSQEFHAIHLDQVHRTSVRRTSVVPLAVLSSVLLARAVVGFWATTDLDLSTRIWMLVASLVLGALYTLTRSVVVSVSAGAHTLTERLAGSDAKMAEAARFLHQVDRASMNARGPVSYRR